MSDAVFQQSSPVFLFIIPQLPLVEDSISFAHRFGGPEAMRFQALAAGVFEQINLTIPLSPQPISLNPSALAVSIFTPRSYEVGRRLNRSAWQARLGTRLDAVKRKVLDNQLLLSAHPTDMLRIRVQRDSRTQDVQTRTIIANEVLPILLPVMKDVPMRRMTRDDASGSVVVSFAMADSENSKPFEAYCPLAGQLQRDDLLFRIVEDPHADLPYLMILQVKDELATLAYSSLLYVKYNLTFYDERLPPEVIAAVVAASAKRSRLTW